MPKSVTIKDIAAEAQVSIATVSRVINQTGGVRKELETRVLQVAKELNYTPNVTAQNLKKSRTSTIAFLVSNISDPFFIEIARGIESYIQNFGYNLIVCSTGHYKERELSYLRHFQGKKVDGLIINSTGYNDAIISELSHSTPIILSNRRIHRPDFVGDFVDNENTGCTYELTKRLLRQGHKRIAIINGPEHLSTAQERYQGFCSAIREAELVVDSHYPYRFNGTFTRQTGYDGVGLLLSLPVPPTAFVFTSSELTFGGLTYFRQHNIRVPDDISLVCVGNLNNHELLYVKPTMSTVNLHGMGERMAALLLERIQSKELIPNRDVLFSSAIRNGNSIKSLM